MSEHEIRALKVKVAAVLFYVAATVSAILTGLPG